MKETMHLISKFCLICIFLCAPFFSKAQAELGDSLALAGDFQHAAIAYEFALFKGVTDDQINGLLLRLARCYKHVDKPHTALQSLDAADFYSGKDSLRFLLFYEYAVNAMLAKRFDVALSKLQELRLERLDTTHNRVLLPLEILCLNQLGLWPEAHLKFKQLATLQHTTENPYPEILSYKPKNPNKAFTLSYFLPGVGQIYAGYFWKGITSTMLHAGLIAFTGWSFITQYYLSGVFTGMALFYLSYNGGARYAQTLAESYNQAKVAEFRQRVAQLLPD